MPALDAEQYLFAVSENLILVFGYLLVVLPLLGMRGF